MNFRLVTLLKTYQFKIKHSDYPPYRIIVYLIENHISNIQCDTIRSEQFKNGHKPTTYEPQVWTSSEQLVYFAGYEYGPVGVFKIKMR